MAPIEKHLALSPPLLLLLLLLLLPKATQMTSRTLKSASPPCDSCEGWQRGAECVSSVWARSGVAQRGGTRAPLGHRGAGESSVGRSGDKSQGQEDKNTSPVRTTYVARRVTEGEGRAETAAGGDVSCWGEGRFCWCVARRGPPHLAAPPKEDPRGHT
ncbi:hypothetical protein E2C01_067599 [Portunus trituberculatus]|uniref:Uncharacterized protein n=1 Tax=Portunus trituberculatus TaxID=210409 RepID=A0A5B7HU70_PORTR|nr:hypothetical protein [Portunus trituberculatus]